MYLKFEKKKKKQTVLKIRSYLTEYLLTAPIMKLYTFFSLILQGTVNGKKAQHKNKSILIDTQKEA